MSQYQLCSGDKTLCDTIKIRMADSDSVWFSFPKKEFEEFIKNAEEVLENNKEHENFGVIFTR